MLDYKRDRLDYGEMLIPPEGFQLNQAVAATYSVDLNTLLSVPVALIYAQTMEGKIDGERFQILEAIRKLSSIVTVYHQKGQLHVPARYNRLYALLEDMLVPVYPETAFTSFHPKVWVLRYTDDSNKLPPRYRVLVLSRNLTYDRSWDIASCLEGTEGTKPEVRSTPLADFLRHLNNLKSFPDAASFIQGIERTPFDPPKGFKRIQFHPIGIPRYYTSPVQEVTGNRAVILSPFVDAGGIEAVASRVSGDLFLFSRHEELLKLNSTLLSQCKACYAISNWIVDGERQLDIEDHIGEAGEQDLHAKVYVYDNGEETRWLMGSSNATKAALTRNTEFLLELVGDARETNVKKLLIELLGDDGNQGVFTPFDPAQATGSDPNIATRNAIRQVEYALLGTPVIAAVTKSENQNTYDLDLRIDLTQLNIPKQLSVFIRPLNVVTDPATLVGGAVNQQTFATIKETELSCFLVYSIVHEAAEEHKFLVRIDITGMPESRHDSIFRSIVNSQDKFFEYLSFLLAEELDKDSLVDESETEIHDSETESNTSSFDAPIFERLLVAASRNPKKLRHVDALIQRLSRDTDDGQVIIPPEFLDFWEVFKPLIPPPGRGAS